VSDPALRQPLADTFEWLQHRLASILVYGQARGELASDLDASAVAAAIVATLQGGYVLARAAGSVEPFIARSTGF
jgi:TetR/AcrR family transcriptional repressor of nem operon